VFNQGLRVSGDYLPQQFEAQGAGIECDRVGHSNMQEAEAESSHRKGV
jgi:hypothetical protein